MKSRKVKTTQIRTNYEKWGEAAAGKDGTIFVLPFHDRFLRDNVGFRSEIKVVKVKSARLCQPWFYNRGFIRTG